jgi:hypothetical protein
VFRDRGTRKLELGRSKRSAGVVEAGAQRVFEIRARVPQRPGRYLLQIDMLHERVRWFSDLGGPGAIVVVDVRLKE